jgi:hypothetical protein
LETVADAYHGGWSQPLIGIFWFHLKTTNAFYRLKLVSNLDSSIGSFFTTIIGTHDGHNEKENQQHHKMIISGATMSSNAHYIDLKGMGSLVPRPHPQNEGKGSDDFGPIAWFAQLWARTLIRVLLNKAWI